MINLIYTILCIFCLSIGFYYGYKLGKGEKIETPTEKVKEVKEKIIRDRKEAQEAEKIEKEIEKFNISLENLASYDGTSNNQKEV